RLVGADIQVAGCANGAAQRKSRRYSDADDSRAAARRPLVSRPGERQRALVGVRAKHQTPVAPRDLGPAVYVDGGELEPALPVERDAGRDPHQVHAHAGGAVSRRAPAETHVRMGGTARTRPQGGRGRCFRLPTAYTELETALEGR